MFIVPIFSLSPGKDGTDVLIKVLVRWFITGLMGRGALVTALNAFLKTYSGNIDNGPKNRLLLFHDVLNYRWTLTLDLLKV